MINISDSWNTQFQFDDVGAAYEAGIVIYTPKVFVPSALPESEITDMLERNNLQLAPGVAALYSQVESVEVIWQLSPKDQKTLSPFQNDPWLKENYLDDGYDWGVVHEMLSGGLGIQPLAYILNDEWIKSQGYYYSFQNMGRDYTEFVVLDLHWTSTALLRVENRVVLDEVWLHNSDAHSLTPMKMGVEKYMETCFALKGIYHWQDALLYGEKAESYRFIERFLSRIFPNVTPDLSGLGI